MWTTVLAASNESAMVAAIAIGGGLTVAVVGIVAGTIQKTYQTKQREQSRREIAAYVAEGTISPEDAAKILSAGGSFGDKLKQRLGVWAIGSGEQLLFFKAHEQHPERFVDRPRLRGAAAGAGGIGGRVFGVIDLGELAGA
jgi:hypothetical protein